MQISKPFSFTIFKDTKTNNVLSVGKNSEYQIYYLSVNAGGYQSKMIRINKNTFDSFFLCENLTIENNCKENIVINTKN